MEMDIGRMEMVTGQMEMDTGLAMGRDSLVESVGTKQIHLFSTFCQLLFSKKFPSGHCFVFVVLSLILFFGNKNRAK